MMKKFYFLLALIALVVIVVAPFFLNKTSEKSKSSDSKQSQFKHQSNIYERKKNELLFCSDPWLPYVGQVSDNEEGYTIDLIREIYKPFGYTVRLVNMPWTRCIAETREGKFNGLTQSEPNEATGFIFSSESIGVTRPTFFAQPNTDWTYTGVNSLKNIRLGVIQTYTYEKSIDEYIQKNIGTKAIFSVKGDDALPKLINLLKSGRIDAFIENRIVGTYSFLKAGAKQNQYRIAGEVPGLKLFLPLSLSLPESIELAKIFNNRIQEMRANGSLQKILARYEVEDWVEINDMQK
jgi:polar amino acid transport system substrate-binding protein